MLELKNVSKFYYNKGVVSSGISKVNLKFNMGEFIAITGESGSGKSTLLNVISGLDSYEEGEMYINGEETSHYTENDYEEYRKKYIGNIFQSFNLVNSYTVYQNVELVLLISGETRKSVKSKVLDILKKVDLYKYRHTKVSKLSGGMKQRVAIARCLAKDTPVIIADEPTGNLDSKNAKSVLKLLYEISKYKLVIIVTHNYEQIEEYATRKITMHDGMVESDVTLKETTNTDKETTCTSNKPKLISNLRLGIRNTFNILPKFLLLTFIYSFVLISIVTVYSSFLEVENTNSISNIFYNENNASKRIIIKKKDNSKFTDEEINKIKNTTNVSEVVLNDYVYDFVLGLTDYENIYLDSNFLKLSSFEGKLTKGRMPENDDEIIISGSSDNYYMTELGDSILNKTFNINILGIEKQIKVVGLQVYEGYDWKVTSYVTDNMYSDISSSTLKDYSFTKVFIDNKLTDEYPSIASSPFVEKGSVYISENYVYSCKTTNCAKDKLNINYKNIYMDKNLELNITKLYNRDNFKRIFNTDYDDMDRFYISEEDYNEMFKSTDVYQLSAFVSDSRLTDKTLSELTDFETFSLNKVTSSSAITQVVKIVKTVILTVLVIVLFFISYFVIKLIIKSRNKYYTTIRILGGSLKEVTDLLKIELLNITNLVFIVFLIISLLIKNNVIVSEKLSNILFYINTKEYIIIYLMLSIMSYLTSIRYSRKIFAKSVITTYNMEV